MFAPRISYIADLNEAEEGDGQKYNMIVQVLGLEPSKEPLKFAEASHDGTAVVLTPHGDFMTVSFLDLDNVREGSL